MQFEQQSQKRFRLQTGQLFLTYPQCPVNKDEVLNALTQIPELKNNINLHVVAQEFHQDENRHVHVYLKLLQKIDVKDPRFADILGYHGNYQGCRSARQVSAYCRKEQDYISNFDVAGYLYGISKKRAIGKCLINNEQSLVDTVQDFPELMLGYKKLKLDIAAHDMDAYKPIVQKKVCEWYYGPTEMGKTWKAVRRLGFRLEMNKPFPEQVYNKDSSNFQWWENYNGQDCVLVDEIALGATGKMMNYLKKWTDKLPCMVEIKGGQTWMKATKFAFTSQHSIDEVFEKAIEKKEVSKEDVRALKRRISMYYINQRQY